MIIKLTLSHPQLEDLHRVLEDKENAQTFDFGHAADATGKRYYVSLKSSRGSGEGAPVPSYEVVLEADTTYLQKGQGGRTFLTPIEKLSRVLQAIGLYPEKSGVRV
jgi:hypothetical protein